MSQESLIATCELGWEQAVLDEWTRTLAPLHTKILAPGWVQAIPSPSQDEPKQAVQIPYISAFSRQLLPFAVEFQQPSISTFAQAIASEIGRKLDLHEGPWRWHVFHNRWSQPELKTANRGRTHKHDAPKNHKGPSSPEGPQQEHVSDRRCELIRDAVLDQLKQRYRRLAKRAHTQESAHFEEEEAFVQLGLLQNDRAFLSILLPEERRVWSSSLSGWKGGDIFVPPDKSAPSRAGQKLHEAILRFGHPIEAEEVCVDLGSSPGGWTWVAIKQGASVIAVDRSPLRVDLLHHPHVTFVQGDAFQYTPPQPVDWLFSDVIAFPQRIFEMLETWLSQRWCKHFCVTIKFQGRDDDAILVQLAEMLSRYTSHFLLRRLKVNKNEVTAWGHLAEN